MVKTWISADIRLSYKIRSEFKRVERNIWQPYRTNYRWLSQTQFTTIYAEANVLTADLEQPLKDKIRPQAFVKLPRDGQYQFSQADPFRFEGILSFKSGYTQVAGHPSSKIAGFTTLATSVLEGLNVLDVVTADRVVAQISTVHPIYGKGQVPSVTFLGTRFDNLRIAGHKVEVERSLDILGPKPRRRRIVL